VAAVAELGSLGTTFGRNELDLLWGYFMIRANFLLGFVLVVSTAHAQTRSVYLEDLTWPEVREAIASGKTTAIVYTGSTEQNGPHMALGKHNFIAHYVARRIAEELGDVLVYPTLPFGIAGNPRKRHRR
jgi:creatinine amidohydrolase